MPPAKLHYRHVMSGVNPQGCQVFSFKAPSAEERDHTYLWRSMKALPERGRIGIHNRSYYEEVLIVRVHPEILQQQQLPPHLKDDCIWKRRFEEINNFEQYLTSNGVVVLKFFLHVSKAEQKRRFIAASIRGQELKMQSRRNEGPLGDTFSRRRGCRTPARPLRLAIVPATTVVRGLAVADTVPA